MKFSHTFTAAFLAATSAAFAGAKAPIPIAEVSRSEPVNFERDVLPFLSDNCLACHCQTTSKGGLNLESRELMLKGGENGAAIVPSKGSESLMLQAAAHQDDDLVMPPRDNKAKAKNLTSEQLGLLKLWIDQGAKIPPKADRVVNWQPLSESLRAIFAVAVTPDGQFAACTRENRVCVYHLPTGRRVMNEAAHRDQVNALVFNPEGMLMASGGYRDVKLWRREKDVKTLSLPDAGPRAAVSADGKWLATSRDDGSVKLWSLPDGKLARTLQFPLSDEAKAANTALPAIVAERFSPDGARLAGAAANKVIVLWNPADGQVVARADAPSEIKGMTWTTDGKQLVTGGADNVVRLWSDALAMTQELKSHTGAVNAVEALAPNRFVTGSADGSLRVWELGKDQPVAQVNHGAPIVAIAVRPDGQRFASASGDNAVKLWAADGKPVAELRGNRYAREFAEASDRAAQVAGATVDYRKQAADAAAKQLTAAQDRVKKSADAIAPKQQDLEAKQKALAEANDAKKAVEQALAAAEADVKKADETLAAADASALQAKSAVEALKAAKPAETPAPASAPPATTVAQATPAVPAAPTAAPAENPNASPEEIAAAKAAAEKVAAEKAAAEKAIAEKAVAEKLAAEKAAAEKAAAEKAAMDKAVADAATKAQEAAKAKQERDQREAMRKQAADKMDPATKKVADAQEAVEKAKTARSVADTELELAKAEEQKMTGEVGTAKSAIEAAEAERAKAGAALQAAQKAAGEAEQPIRTLAFSPDNTTLVTAGEDHCIHTWSAETGAPIEVLKGHEAAVSSLAFAGPDSLVSAASDVSAMTWNLKPEWKLERTLGGGEPKSPFADRVNALAFSHDGKLLATGGGEPSRGGEIKIWNVADGSVARDFSTVHTDAVFGLEFSPDDRYLASGAADKMARVLDLSTGKVVRSFEGHTHHVLSVAWSLDGRTLVTAGADNMVKVWDFTNGERKKNIEGFDKEVTAVRVAAVNGDFLTSSGDNRVRLMALDGREIRSFPEVADFMESAAVTADGKVVVAGGEDGVFRIWNGVDGGKIAVFPADAK